MGKFITLKIFVVNCSSVPTRDEIEDWELKQVSEKRHCILVEEVFLNCVNFWHVFPTRWSEFRKKQRLRLQIATTNSITISCVK